MANTILHKAETRGHANHGWLDSHHTFSFANYYNPERMGFGALRVLNDDCVDPGMGFGKHPHDNMEIISIPLSGDLEHKDSMGNVAVIKSGDIQVMSAGTGITHSEYNKNTDSLAKFLQIWVNPNQRNVKPRYDQITLDLSERHNKLQQIVSPYQADRQSLEQQRLVELLDRIGPAFVVSNSLGGPAGFLVADARPDLVVALVQLEPIGPAFATMFGPDTLQWGVAAAPMTFDPPASSPSELSLDAHEPPAPGAPATVLQNEPARRLSNLAKVPIAVVSGEASVFRFTDGPLVEFLQQAGCDAVHIELAERGVHGNSHGSMFELNNAEVLTVVTDWMADQLG